jgi:hypothetical protein
MHAPDRDLRDPRRSARVPARWAADVRHRFSRWQAETEDLGAEGVQLVSPRLVPPGRELRLLVDVPGLQRTVQGTATVVWARAAAPSRLGVRFAPDREDRGWFESLLAADPNLARAAQRLPGSLPLRSPLFLGEPPRLVVDFTRDELAVLRRLRPGMAVADLLASFGTTPERLAGALFALVSRGQIVLTEGASRGPAAWREVLAQASATEVADGHSSEHALRPSAVQSLLDEGRGHLAAGRFALAAARFQAAQDLAPDDAEPCEQLRRIQSFK